MSRESQFSARSRCSGLSLLEALIALLVFSSGLLGVVAMQVSGMRFTQSAQTLSIGSFLAEDMVERMRANLAGAGAGEYDNQCVCHGSCADATLSATCVTTATTCPSDLSTFSRTCYGADCTTPAAIRAADMAEWLVKTCETTPPGTLAGVLCSGTCTATSVRRVVVSWIDTETSTSSPTSSRQLNLSFRPIAPRN